MQGHKSCPECGADWQKVTIVDESLSDFGYLHIDRRHECSECHAQWVHGEPHGEFSNPELVCPVCGDVMRYHKRDPRQDGKDTLHWKCPTCFYWTDEFVEVPMDNGEFVAGYPDITGDLDKEVSDSDET